MTVFTKTLTRQFPTRLRLRFPQLRRAPWACARLGAALRQVDGVVTVEASAAVGSVLVIYHVHAEAEPALLDRLQAVFSDHGLSCAGVHGAAHDEVHGATGSVRPPDNGVADRLAGAVVERLVERSAMALVAALF